MLGCAGLYLVVFVLTWASLVLIGASLVLVWASLFLIWSCFGLLVWPHLVLELI